MPYYTTSQEWLTQSQALLEARPTTTRITTKYSIKQVKPRHKPNATVNPTPKPPRGSLTLKTYDPVSGATLKYRTTKAAEVSRLILSLGKLSRPMAGLPELKEEVMADAPAEGSGTGTPALEKGEAAAPAQQQPQASGGGGGKGKKKKGKK